MFRNLAAEMARNGLTRKDIAEKANVDQQSIKNKMLGKTEFTLLEMVLIKRSYFPKMTLDYLFKREEDDLNIVKKRKR